MQIIERIEKLSFFKDIKKIHNWKVFYPGLLMVLVLLVLTLLEVKHPYFFLQDDNRDSYLPYFVHSYDSLLHGELAFYNFHQFQGIPAFGQTGALYPFTYLAVFISKLFFGHYFAAIDVYVFIHLIIGALGCYKLKEYISGNPKAALFCGLTWSLSSFIIYASNSWVIVSAVAAYFPWMIVLSFKLQKKVTLSLMVALTAVRLLLFYTGNTQYFVYSMIFEFMTTLLFAIFSSEKTEKRRSILVFFKRYILSYICVFLLSLPLLLPMWDLTASSGTRSSKLIFDEFATQYYPLDQLVKSLLYPFLTVTKETFFSYRNFLSLSHIGFIPLVLLICGFYNKVIRRTPMSNRSSLRLSTFVFPAILAFSWSTQWVFNLFVYLIPILNRFRWPFKVIIYFDFYLIVISALVLSHLLLKSSWKIRTKNLLFFLLIACQLVNFWLLYSCAPYRDFGEHHADKLPLVEELREELDSGRIVSIGFGIWADTPQNNGAYLTAPTLGFNYSTLWGLDHFAGYEILLSDEHKEASLGINFTAIMSDDEKIPVEQLRKAGVAWYVVAPDKASKIAIELEAYGIQPKYEDTNRVIFHDPLALPMISDSDGDSLDEDSITVMTNSIRVKTNQAEAGTLNFNYMYHSYFEATIDGVSAELVNTEDGHFYLNVPAGVHDVLIEYCNPYAIFGFYVAGAFIGLILIYSVIKNISMRRRLNGQKS